MKIGKSKLGSKRKVWPPDLTSGKSTKIIETYFNFCLISSSVISTTYLLAFINFNLFDRPLKKFTKAILIYQEFFIVSTSLKRSFFSYTS